MELVVMFFTEVGTRGQSKESQQIREYQTLLSLTTVVIIPSVRSSTLYQNITGFKCWASDSCRSLSVASPTERYGLRKHKSTLQGKFDQGSTQPVEQQMDESKSAQTEAEHGNHCIIGRYQSIFLENQLKQIT